MKSETLLIRGGRIIDPSRGIDAVGDLAISGGKIQAVGESKSNGAVLDATGMIVTPGFVDLHCHLRDPGFEDKETIASGTLAAARGGFTTVCCMPNTNPTIDSRATVEYIHRKAAAEGAVRVLPIGCISKGQLGELLAEMGELAQSGVVAFSDDGKPVVSSRLMRQALDYSRAFGLPVIDHCQDPALSQGGVMNEGWVATRLGLKGMPAAAEEAMVARDIALAELTGARVHIAHVSTAGSVELVRRAKQKGLLVTAEATPHHLTLTQEQVMGKGQVLAYNTNAKVNPPLRSEEDVRALVQGLRDGVIEAIATDHAPHTLVDKLCEFDEAAFGISGFETALGSLLGLVQRGEMDLVTLVARLTLGPANIVSKAAPGLGTLKPGASADIVIIDPNAEWVVDPRDFASKGKNTPLAGAKLKGKVVVTIFGGKIVYQDSRLTLAEGKR